MNVRAHHCVDVLVSAPQAHLRRELCSDLSSRLVHSALCLAVVYDNQLSQHICLQVGNTTGKQTLVVISMNNY